LLYRAVGSRLIRAGKDPTDSVAAESAAHALSGSDLDGTDLRGPEADEVAPVVAAIPAVRVALLSFQRQFASGRGAVMDGRDIGTVIFPDAPVKLFVTANLATRARRRWLEMRERGLEVSLEAVEHGMKARDTFDAARATSPLRPAWDATVLDTTELDPNAAYEAAFDLVRRRIPAGTGLRL
jgi:CMP/dCMP kinase